MTDVPKIHGPKPEFQFCTVCAMLAKGGATPDGKITMIVEEAVAIGIPAIFGPPQIGGNGLIGALVPVCWSHLVGVKIQNEGGLVSPLAAPPGVLENLAKGRG